MHWQERIVSTPGVVGGRPCIKGTRLSVSLILELMSAGSSEAEVLKAHPHISSADVRACLRYAAQSLEPPITTETDAWIAGVPSDSASPISDVIEGKVIPCEARALLVNADERIRKTDYGKGSRLLWQAVEWTIRDVAARRGWPAENEKELESVIERLDMERDGKHVLAGDFGNALEIRDNADGQYLSADELEFYAELMPPFIESIFAAASTPS